MTFRYRSPNDKSILMGGLGSVVSYVAPQNTCPSAGTVVSTYNVLDNRSWHFDIYSGGYTSGEVAVFQDFYNNVADGNCGTTSQFSYSTPLVNAGNAVAVNYDGYTDRWRVVWDGSDLIFQDYTMYAPYGTYSNDSSGIVTIYISEIDSNVAAGDGLYSMYADGYGGYYSALNFVNWYPSNQQLATWDTVNSKSYDPANDQYYDNGYYTYNAAISNGSGGYSIDSVIGGSYYEYGTVVRTHSDEPIFATWGGNHSFQTGTFNRIDRIWDGAGNFTYSDTYLAGSCFVEWTQIGDPSTDRYYYDSNGNGPYYLYWNGTCGIYDSYQGGSNCDGYGTSYGLTCSYSEGYDANNTWWNGYWTRVEQIADGSCGTIDNYVGTNMDGCYYPYGFWHSYNYYPSNWTYEVIDSVSNIMASGEYTFSWYGDGYYADGYGGQIYYSWSGQLSYGDLISTGSFYDSNLAQDVWYDVVSDGSTGYIVNYYY